MGTDETYAIVKENERFVRSAIRAAVTEHWTGRGAKLVGSRWSKAAVWTKADQTCFAVAIAPPSKRGWVTVVESTEYSLGFDGVLLDHFGKNATTWICWSLDHSAMYGQRKVSRAASDEPVDLGAGADYESLRGKRGWAFLVFDGVRPMKFKRFEPTEKLKSHELPRDLDDELESSFATAVTQLEVERAIEIVQQLDARASDSMISMVFEPRYPIEWPEPADGVTRIGLALADVRPLPPDAWVRLLEVAAVQKDTALRDRALAGLKKAHAKKVAEAVAEAKERFDERKEKAATKRFVEWLRGDGG